MVSICFVLVGLDEDGFTVVGDDERKFGLLVGLSDTSIGYVVGDDVDTSETTGSSVVGSRVLLCSGTVGVEVNMVGLDIDGCNVGVSVSIAITGVLVGFDEGAFVTGLGVGWSVVGLSVIGLGNGCFVVGFMLGSDVGVSLTGTSEGSFEGFNVGKGV